MYIKGDILKKEDILIKNRNQPKDNKEDYNLGIILSKHYGSYIVAIDCEYDRDNNYMRNTRAFDYIPFPISQNLIKEFNLKEYKEAENFYYELIEKINTSIKPFDLNIVKNDIGDFKCHPLCEYTYEKDYDTFGEREKVEDEYFKVLINFDYNNRLLVRLFKRKNEIVINKKYILKFENSDITSKAYDLLKNYFEAFETLNMTELGFQKEVCHSLLNSIINGNENIPFSNLKKLNYRYDEYNRLTSFEINLSNNDDKSLNVTFRLPTRNGVYWDSECEGKIWGWNVIETNSSGNYFSRNQDKMEYFGDDLKKYLSLYLK